MSALAHNIRRYRVLRGFNQGELAAAAGISRNAYRAIETGAAEPRNSNLRRIADVLDVSILDLMREVPELESLRFRCKRSLSGKQRALRDDLISDAAIWLRDYNELEALTNQARHSRLPLKKGRSPEALASAVRKWMGYSDEQPVYAICDVLEKKGIKVHLFESDLDKVFGFSVGEADGGPAIGVNVREEIPVERQIFTAVHELGHLVLHQKSDAHGGETEETKAEAEANVFAGSLLMPPGLFDEQWQETRGLHFVDRVMKVKRFFLVSYMTVLMRLIKKEVVDKSIWLKFRILYEKRYGAKLPPLKEPASVESFMFIGADSRNAEPATLGSYAFVEDRLAALVREAIEGDLISVDRGAEVLRCSISEMRDRMESWEAVP